MSQNLRFVTPAELESERLDWGHLEWMCRSGLCDAEQLMLCRVHIEPGQGHNFHRHPQLEEIIYVIEGQAEQWVDQQKRILQGGETAHIPRDVVHATFNCGSGTLVVLAILSPAKHEGPFLVEVADEEPWRSLR